MFRSRPRPIRRVLLAAVLATNAVALAACGESTGPKNGTLSVVVTGLPTGASAVVTVRKPNGEELKLTGSQSIEGPAGAYDIIVGQVSSFPAIYRASAASQRIEVPSGKTATATVAYEGVPGSADVTVTGLPEGATPSVTLVSATGIEFAVGSQSWRGTTLPPGNYTVRSSPVLHAGAQFLPRLATATTFIRSEANAEISVGYDPSPDLSIYGAYVVQAVQDVAGSVPLVAGRGALIRVFGKADRTNYFAASVRVRVYDGEAVVQTYTIPGPSSAPQAIDEGNLTASWTQVIPGNLVFPGMRVTAEIDPAGVVVEPDEANNVWPVGGVPASLTVRSLPNYDLVFVPVLDGAGTTGAISPATVPAMMGPTLGMIPLNSYTTSVRAPLQVAETATTDAEWSSILSQVRAARIADGAGGTYYGVVRRYGAWSGLGYVGYPAAIGRENAASTLAHELGHTLNRRHAPCGGPAGPDPSYPYPDGSIGIYGWNGASVVGPLTKDFMSYCDPEWISAYNYVAIMNFRIATGRLMASAPMKQRTLLVTGTITPSGVSLEPAFDIETLPVPAEGAGPNRLTVRGDGGVLLYDAAFSGDEIDHRDGHRGFAFAVPLPINARVESVEVTGPSGTAVLRQSPPTPGRTPFAPTRRKVDAERVELRWDAVAGNHAMVRDAVTGETLAFLRGGTATLRSRGGPLELVTSNGVRSTRVVLQ